MSKNKPCTCWAEVAIHSGHCCMKVVPDDYWPGEPLSCGHLDEGLAILRKAEHGEARRGPP